MMRIAALALFAASGCVVYEEDHYYEEPPPEPVNYAPDVTWAEAGCYWDGYYYDDIWYFSAEVDDPNGVYDVIAVYADVYDNRTGAWVDSFELYPTNDPYVWFSDWLGSSTYLSCHYYDYSVDLVAYDSYESWSVMTVAPYYY